MFSLKFAFPFCCCLVCCFIGVFFVWFLFLYSYILLFLQFYCFFGFVPIYKRQQADTDAQELPHETLLCRWHMPLCLSAWCCNGITIYVPLPTVLNSCLCTLSGIPREVRNHRKTRRENLAWSLYQTPQILRMSLNRLDSNLLSLVFICLVPFCSYSHSQSLPCAKIYQADVLLISLHNNNT